MSSGMQQHALPQGGQGEQSSSLCLPKLRLQDGSRQLLHLCEQNHARDRVSFYLDEEMSIIAVISITISFIPVN